MRNEVIANRALELLGHGRGEYKFMHPLEHVNLSQSTNDVYPTAVKVALRFLINDLIEGMEVLRLAFAGKPRIQRPIENGAYPITRRRAHDTWAGIQHLRRDARRRPATFTRRGFAHSRNEPRRNCYSTGINAHPEYASLARKYLSEITGIEYITAGNLVEATQDVGSFVQLSGVLKRVAVKLSKICNDLRLLSSGPRTGLGEINLPAVQAGSSIMPGKVNPVIPEVVNQIAFLVIGNDVTVSFAAEADNYNSTPSSRSSRTVYSTVSFICAMAVSRWRNVA